MKNYEMSSCLARVGRQLAIGFNRRWSPAVLAAVRALSEISAPKLITYRIAAGKVPDGHWYHDRRQGGRLLGEVCHFVDAAQALVGAPIEEVGCVQGGRLGGQPGDDAIVSLRFADGSLAAIVYGSAEPGPVLVPARSGSRCLPGPGDSSSTISARPGWTGACCGRAARTRATAPASPPSVRRWPAALTLPTEAMLATMRATITAAGGEAL